MDMATATEAMRAGAATGGANNGGGVAAGMDVGDGGQAAATRHLSLATLPGDILTLRTDLMACIAGCSTGWTATPTT